MAGKLSETVTNKELCIVLKKYEDDLEKLRKVFAYEEKELKVKIMNIHSRFVTGEGNL